MNHSAPSPAGLFSLRPHRLLLAAVLCFSCSIVLAQPGMPTGANYTDDMPSVARRCSP